MVNEKKKIFCGNISSNRGASPGRTLEASFTPSNLWLRVDHLEAVLIGYKTEVHIAIPQRYLHDTTAGGDLIHLRCLPPVVLFWPKT